MPHLIVEHSSTISSEQIRSFQKTILSLSCLSDGEYAVDQFKCRSISFDKFLVGDLDESNSLFIHITLKALSGRSIEIKKNLSDKILQCAKDFFKELNFTNLRCDISVDMVDMDRVCYSKISLK